MTSQSSTFVGSDDIQTQFNRIAPLYATIYGTPPPPAELCEVAIERLQLTGNASPLEIAVCALELLDEWRVSQTCRRRAAA